MDDLRRPILIGLGSLLVALALVGVFLPLLPTTPLLLLAAACYARSSDRFYHWLVDHQRLGPYVRDFRSGRGIPLQGKVMGLICMWAAILYAVFFTASLLAGAVLLLIAMGASGYLVSLPTSRS
ncbi:MAG: YbaN family protein [Anaerolineae bacterium]|nr:YbaN family protein [Anaerolineae bacterium]